MRFDIYNACAFVLANDHRNRFFGGIEPIIGRRGLHLLSMQYPVFRGGTLLPTSGVAGILVVTFDPCDAFNNISKNVVAPWFTEDIRLI